MRMRFIYLLLIVFQFANGQELLVNGDFEEENICTEYRVNCAPEGWVSTANGFSNYMKRAAAAYHGRRFMGIDAGSGNVGLRRTFICSQLLCRLRKGNKYAIRFFLKSKHPLLDSIGVYFTAYHFLFERNLGYRITPSVYVTDSKPQFRKGDTSWQQVNIVYEATGLENFITIGNFSKRLPPGEPGFTIEDRNYVFIDKISFTPVDSNEKICPDWLAVKEEIYGRNERHEMQERMVRFYNSRNQRPEPPSLTLTLVPAVNTLKLPDIFFATGKAVLESGSHQLLDSLANGLQGLSIDSVVIEGNTDNTGSVALNEALSASRAEAVKQYLLSKNSLRENAFIVRGNGSSKNVASNTTAAGRQRNRRVDIYLYLRN
jgi:outer membrane protein OmpA-like peptidoglycan-associated protein